MAFLSPAIRDSALNAQATRRNRASLNSLRPQSSLTRVFLGESSSHVTIEALPDEVLLKIFDFCRTAPVDRLSGWQGPWPKIWQNLVHVCQRWRYVVFSSPLRLDLRIYCSDKTPARETLDVWPAFPIEIFQSILMSGITSLLHSSIMTVCARSPSV
jgi:F-box-like